MSNAFCVADMISAKTSACVDLLREYQHKGRSGLGKCDVCKVNRSGTTGRQARNALVTIPTQRSLPQSTRSPSDPIQFACGSTTKSLFQLVCEIFGGLGSQGLGRERMGGRGAHPDSPPPETRLIAPNVAGSADAQMEKEFKSSRWLELAENSGTTTRKK
ncbi:hypothetical protein C8J57DRAFT_1226215 [Mycena rebaudengoi]|nr:hypothetical protein C8J57DRAFT_1226215 [Mycena rebaudengoi]